jgi:hypothetical protein
LRLRHAVEGDDDEAAGGTPSMLVILSVRAMKWPPLSCIAGPALATTLLKTSALVMALMSTTA